MREKVGRSRNSVFFQWFGAPEGRKVGSLKRRVQNQLARWEMKKCTPLWGEAHLEVKMNKTHQVRTTFGSWDVEKVHAIVARSTFGSQNVQNTRGSDHFWKLRCRKSARRCGAKHIWKSKCTKHQGFGPLLEVAMSKKCTPLWRETHFEAKMCKTPGVWTRVEWVRGWSECMGGVSAWVARVSAWVEWVRGWSECLREWGREGVSEWVGGWVGGRWGGVGGGGEVEWSGVSGWLGWWEVGWGGWGGWGGVEWSEWVVGLVGGGVGWVGGVEWSGVEWSGVEWSGVEWSGVERTEVDGGGRTGGTGGGGGGGGGADTELKIKSPYVNVGN